MVRRGDVMKRGWKVGDRCIVSYISAVGIMCAEKATIKAINPGGGLVVEKDRAKGETGIVHPGQLRRLIRKKRREFEISCDARGLLGVITFGSPLEPGDKIVVREVPHDRK